jgi:ribosomal protein L37AE/L43A
MAAMSHGSVPFFCPFCGDEEIRPYGETHGEWRCESCRRAFALRTVKQAVPADRRTPDDQVVSPERAEVAR